MQEDIYPESKGEEMTSYREMEDQAYRFLFSRGYRLQEKFQFSKPKPNHWVRPEEWDALNVLLRIGYGTVKGILCDSHTDIAGEKEMPLHKSTFEHLKSTVEQISQMAIVREAGLQYAMVLDTNIPKGPDKTYALRKHREVAMWANIAITRNPDGSPRT